jgi:transposase
MGDPGARVRRSIVEKRRIVELTFEPGASVARVAQAESVNSHQVFQWRRAYRQGGLALAGGSGPALLPVIVQQQVHEACGEFDTVVADEVESRPEASGAIHIEFPGRATISVERGADAALLRTVLESLRR